MDVYQWQCVRGFECTFTGNRVFSGPVVDVGVGDGSLGIM